MHWMEQTAKPTAIDGEQRYPGKMALLCWCKAEAAEALIDLGVWQSFLLRVDASMRFALSECILFVTLQHHADFNRRFVIMIRSSLCNLFIIAKRAQDIKCLERLAVCKELLITADEKLHVIVRKLNFLQRPARVLC